MTTRAHLDAGRLVVEGGRWSLVQARPGRPFLELRDAHGRWAVLAAVAAADTTDGPDEWWAVGDPEIETWAGGGVSVRWPVRSARWSSSQLVLVAFDDRLAVRLEVQGRGVLTDVRLLGGRGSAWPGMDAGRVWSARAFESLVSGGPGAPSGVVAPAVESAASGVIGHGHPGGGRWFFTPGPLSFAAARQRTVDAGRLPAGPWLGVGVAVGDVAEATFTQVAWEADDRAFAVRLEYEGHTRVDGPWASPWLVLVPGAPDPYAALASAAVEPSPATPAAAPRTEVRRHTDVPRIPDWWLEPMFCGWGAQWAEATTAGVPPQSRSTQARYDAWLARLEAHGVSPGTVVIDDKWQRTYGRNEPDESRWPDLPGWVDRQHGLGRRVLLWWKAWDPEGLPAEWCVRDASGRGIAADPTNPDFAEALGRDIGRLLAPPSRGGVGADGLKVDFTASTPSGAGLRTFAGLDGSAPGGPWGIALLHRLLEIVAVAARRARPDALIVTHTPNALFRDVTSMIRLNDALRLDDPDPLVPVLAQLRHRAAIAAAALPGVPIDTDDWAMPSLAEWRAWQLAKPEIGVPALYHVDGLGTTGERLTAHDLALVAREWAAYRERVGLPPRP